MSGGRTGTWDAMRQYLLADDELARRQARDAVTDGVRTYCREHQRILASYGGAYNDAHGFFNQEGLAIVGRLLGRSRALRADSRRRTWRGAW